jgi:hypothetical protein
MGCCDFLAYVENSMLWHKVRTILWDIKTTYGNIDVEKKTEVKVSTAKLHQIYQHHDGESTI